MADDFTSARTELEQVLVRQFKLLKQLVALTQKERATLLNDPMPCSPWWKKKKRCSTR